MLVSYVWLLFGLVVLASTLYGKMPRPILKKTNRLTQAVVFPRKHFLCGALSCNCSSAEREGYMYSGNVQQNSLCVASCVTKICTSLPGSRLRFYIAMQIQYSYSHTSVQQYLHATFSCHIVRDEWRPAAAAWADETTACGEEPMTDGRTQHGTPIRLAFLHAKRASQR